MLLFPSLIQTGTTIQQKITWKPECQGVILHRAKEISLQDKAGRRKVLALHETGETTSLGTGQQRTEPSRRMLTQDMPPLGPHPLHLIALEN
ncbi:DNA damage-regulated autophagy modulator protein 2 [Manis javanica]|nr:DNA damage-regulated autophagy modulator protein 2 [Manis javanica]